LIGHFNDLIAGDDLGFVVVPIHPVRVILIDALGLGLVLALHHLQQRRRVLREFRDLLFERRNRAEYRNRFGVCFLEYLTGT